jgi:hypothetical protein
MVPREFSFRIPADPSFEITDAAIVQADQRNVANLKLDKTPQEVVITGAFKPETVFKPPFQLENRAASIRVGVSVTMAKPIQP